MATQWLRRALLLAAGASALLLAACGGGSVDSQFRPTRIVTFGDAMADAGQNGKEYTVNGTGAIDNWTRWVANNFLVALKPSSEGGTAYATGNARVTATPDAAGNGSTPTVQQQVSTFLGASAPASTDMFLLNAGTSDVIVHAKAVLDGTETQAAATDAVAQAGKDLGAQVRRLTDAGATHVVVVGPYNLGRSPWAIQTSQQGLLQSLSGKFNDQLLVSIVDLGDKVLYVDAALYFNLVTASPSAYNMTDATTPICTSIDPGPGIGTGNNQVNSNLCTATTVIANANPATYVFADRVYPGPRSQQLFGDYALSRITARW